MESFGTNYIYKLCLLCASFRVIDAPKIPQPLLRRMSCDWEVETHSDTRKSNSIVRKGHNAFRFFRLDSLRTPCATRKCRQCGFHKIQCRWQFSAKTSKRCRQKNTSITPCLCVSHQLCVLLFILSQIRKEKLKSFKRINFVRKWLQNFRLVHQP